MPVTTQALKHHLEYSAWANARLLSSIRQLPEAQLKHDFGTADRSILGTFGHIYGAEKIWLERVSGQPPVWHGAPPLEELICALPELAGRWVAWAATLGPEDPERPIAYHDMKGNPHREPLWQILLHVVNHSTHHRGQVAGFLRSLGHIPPPLDFIAFVRETAKAAER